MKIVAFLQNLWVKDPEAVRRIFARHPNPDFREGLLRRFLFYKSRTGQTLRAGLGQKLVDLIVWEESTTQIGGDSRKVFSPEIEHIKDVLRRHRPDIVLTFGLAARTGVFRAGCEVLADDRPPVFIFWTAPHPCARPDQKPLVRLQDLKRRIEYQLKDWKPVGDQAKAALGMLPTERLARRK